MRITREVQRRIFFKNLVQRDADLLLVLTRFRLDRKCNRCLRILDWIINNWRLLVAECVASSRLFKFYTGNDVACMRFTNLVELFPWIT